MDGLAFNIPGYLNVAVFFVLGGQQIMLRKKLMRFSYLRFSVILKSWVRVLEKSLTIYGVISRVLLNLAIMIMLFVLERINFETFLTNFRLHLKTVRLPFLRLNCACDNTITVSAS